MIMKKYQVVFCQGSYSHIDFETTDYNQAQEVRRELQNDMTLCGERDFYIVIREVNI